MRPSGASQQSFAAILKDVGAEVPAKRKANTQRHEDNAKQSIHAFVRHNR
jgi:hypothetical protein